MHTSHNSRHNIAISSQANGSQSVCPIENMPSVPNAEARTTTWNNEIPHLKRFDDFETVDWIQVNLQSHKKRLSLQNSDIISITKLYESLQNYVILTLVGITIGLIAACLNIVTEFLSNIRTGYCSTHYYLNRSFCCWGELDESKCKAWTTYSSFETLNYIIFISISLLLAYISCKLVMSYAPLAAGSGISEIKCIVSGFNLNGFLSFWTFLIKSIGLPLAIASGLSVGKEGPSVHYAVCVGSIISKVLLRSPQPGLKLNQTLVHGSSLTYRNILVASSAAGVAVAFGSPMGGVLFSIEEISNLFKLSTMWESYYCSLVAVTLLKLVNPFHTGQVVMFEVSYDRDWHFFEIPFFMILGAFGGVYGILISKFNIKVVTFRKIYLKSFALKEVLFLALLTSMISYFNEFLKLDMTEGMQILFQVCDNSRFHEICEIDKASKVFRIISTMGLATIIRMVLIILTYGCKVPAGIFVPSMACGATFGRALGMIVQQWHLKSPESAIFLSGCLVDDPTCITPGAYAFLGAAATLSGITHLTVTVVIIMFELTGALKYIIPTMIVVSVTKIINDKWGKGGIADQMIVFNGLPFIDPHEEHDFFNHPVSDAMTKTSVTLTETGITYKNLSVIIADTSYQTFPIIKNLDDPIIKGAIGRNELLLVSQLAQAQGQIDLDAKCYFKSDNIEEELEPQLDGTKILSLNFKNYIDPSPLSVDLDVSLESVMDIFHKLGPRCIFVEKDGVLQGLLTRKDILKYEHYLHHLEDPLPVNSESSNALIFNVITKINDFFTKTLPNLILSKFRKGGGRYFRLNTTNEDLN